MRIRATVAIIVMALLIEFVSPFTYAAEENKNVIELSDSRITVNGEDISDDKNEKVYWTDKMDNGGTSSEAQAENVDIDNIININEAGKYEFTGNLSNGQIAVNANDIDGEVEIILNNVDITCEVAPAIFVYSTDVENEKCKIIITLADGSENTISGGKLKTNVEGFEDQNSILYYIEKDYDDDGSYYERYKYDGAISSDVSLTFEGTGILNVNSLEKEGIESKMHITINDGTYIIKSLDDGINACTDKKSIITINGGLVVVDIQSEAEEGDGIDSNGSMYINGGTVYAFACPGSDNGLDSDDGTYINGGTVFSTGSMYEEFSSEEDKTIVQMQFSSKVNEGDSIVIVDENGEPVFAYKADRSISTIAYSSEDLEGSNYSVYTGTSIEGTVGDYNIYSNIETVDLENMTEQENTGMSMQGGRRDMNVEFENIDEEQNDKELMIIKGVLIGVGIITVVCAIVCLFDKKN